MTSLRAFLGIFPKTGEYEAKRQKLEDEYKAILDFESSLDFKRYNELDRYIRSKEFAEKKHEILSMRFQKTEDYHKEMELDMLSKTKAISLYYRIKDSSQLNEFRQTEKSEELKKYLKLEKLIKSEDFINTKKEYSRSANEKFASSDLAKMLNKYESLRKSEKIKGYRKFINDKAFRDYESANNSDLDKKITTLQKKINTKTFQDKKASMTKLDFKTSDEKKLIDEYNSLIKSRVYKNYQKMEASPHKKYFDDLHLSSELKSFEELEKFIKSNDFSRQKKEIKTKGFKDIPEYGKFLEFNHLAKSKLIRNYLGFKDSKAFLNYESLDGSVRIKEFEKLKAYINSEKFIQKKSYYTQSHKKRWKESKEYTNITEFEHLQNSDQFKWYFKNREAKKFSWLKVWHETFTDDFEGGKLNTKKWIPRYFYGEALLKESYSLSHDKHFVTNGQNLDFGATTLQILTKKETVKGKSWHPKHGFITREFGYTSGLINTGKSFRQQFGTFEAKIKLDESKSIQNAFWMVSKTMVPHIDIAKANKKIMFGNIWGDSKDLKSLRHFSKSVGRSKFTADYYIYSLEWTPTHLSWRINGEEVASSSHGVPQEPMYLVFSAGLHKDTDNGLPAKMEIDWVRCYQHEKYQ